MSNTSHTRTPKFLGSTFLNSKLLEFKKPMIPSLGLKPRVDLSREVSRDVSREVSRDMSRDMSRDVSRDLTKNVTKDVSRVGQNPFPSDFHACRESADLLELTAQNIPDPQHICTTPRGSQIHAWSAFPLPALERSAEVVVYLPADYHTNYHTNYHTKNISGRRHYPVLYIQDGQNVFSSSTPYVQSWKADQVADTCPLEQLPIIVAISSTPDYRCRSLEYCPFDDAILGNSRSHVYVQSLIHTIKPHIDTHFRTLPDAAHTGILGAGLGGLLSLYTGLNHPDHFGFAAAVSPDLWGWALSLRAKLLHQQPHSNQQFYFDIGTAEHDSMVSTEERLKISRTFHRFLMRRGYTVNYQEIEQALHNELHWSQRLPHILELFHQFSHKQPGGGVLRELVGG
jgi:predicted alpha/beta superfamily hydrolase